MITKNSDIAVKKTTNKIAKGADDSGTRNLNRQDQKRKKSDFDVDYVNEQHVQDFKKALEYDPIHATTVEPEHISAWSDALPVRSISTGTVPKKSSKRSRRQLAEQEAAKPKGVTHGLMQYPLICVIGTIMFVELIAYISLRQIVRIWENLISWRGKKRVLRKQLRAANTYKEWCESADALDKHMHKDDWKKTIPYAFYDYRLLQKVVKHLKMYRKGDQIEDATKLMDVLYVCLKQNFAGIENAKLYSNSYLGTKTLIEEYVEEVTRSIKYLVENKHVSTEDKRLAFKLYSKNYGRTAFCLSGGAGFGYYHLGVIRALLDRGLLPSIITGTSAGSLMGAIVCTRTDEELNEILSPELARRINICQGTWFQKFMRYGTTGAIFDSEEWCRIAMWFCKGSLTFKEAYERTGRIFNVSVIPYDPHSPPKLLNYLTAPDCVIWSAVIASAAIPGILNPVVLMQKKSGTEHLIPYNYGHKFKDGSLSTDIPTLALNTQFNVNYTIVSQVNPHVHVFFYANQGSPGRPVTHLQGRGWRGGFLASTIEQMLKLDLAKWLKVLRSLKLLPKVHDQDWSSVFLQKFDGNVTILPKSDITDWFHLLADPGNDRLKRMMLSGQSRTWPKISMISNRMRIEASIEKARKALRQQKSSRSRTNSGHRPESCEFSKVSELVEANDNVDNSLPPAHGNHSDSGSGDELVFLSRRRVSMPDGSFHPMTDKDFFQEQNRRRKFMAQFNDSSLATSSGSMKSKTASRFDDSDSDSHFAVPSSPDSPTY